MNELNRLLNCLIFYSNNFRVLHWNMAGKDFDADHILADDYRKMLDDYIDEIAEIILMTGGRINNFIEVCENIKDDDEHYFLADSSKSYDRITFYEAIDKMFSHLIKLYEDAREDVSDDIASTLDDHTYTIRKELSYKNKRRLS